MVPASTERVCGDDECRVVGTGKFQEDLERESDVSNNDDWGSGVSM